MSDVSAVAFFHNQKSFPGYDNIPLRSVKSSSNDAANVSKILSQPAKDVFERQRTYLNNAKVIINPEVVSPKDTISSIAENSLDSIKDTMNEKAKGGALKLVEAIKAHKAMTAFVLTLAAIGGGYGAKKVYDNKQKTAQA